jgi:hypothetical protein
VVSIWPASQPFIGSRDCRCLCWQHRRESPFTSGSDLSSHSVFALVGRIQLFASDFDRLPVAGQLCGRRATSDVCVCDPDTTADVRCWRPTSISPFPPIRLLHDLKTSSVGTAGSALCATEFGACNANESDIRFSGPMHGGTQRSLVPGLPPGPPCSERLQQFLDCEHVQA